MVKAVLVKEPMHIEVAEYLYKADKGKVVSKLAIARVIQAVKERHGTPTAGRATKEVELNRWIAKCREYLELHRGCTLWNIKGEGYRVASADELAKYTAKQVRRTIVHADRTTRLLDIVDRKKMPKALAEVFTDNEGRIRTLGKSGRRYLTTFLNYMKEERKKLEVQE